MFSLKDLKEMRRILMISLLTFGLIFIPVGFSATNDTMSSKPNTTSSMAKPINKGQQFQKGIIDGAVNPEMIPDRIAYTLLFRVIGLAQESTDLEQERVSSFVKDTGIEGKDTDRLLAVAREFRRQVGSLDDQVAEIKDRYWPNPGPDVMDKLGQLQNEKEAIVEKLVTSLPSYLGQDAHRSLHGWVNDHIKHKIKLALAPPNAANPHHTSLHLPGTQPITLASVKMSAHSSLASSRPSLQGMAGSAIYSDIWVNSNWNRIWGCGVTEDYYNTYGHQYYVRTTLTSPNGRTASSTSYTSSSHAYAEVRLDWPMNDSDLGEYPLTTDHFTLCPYIGLWVPTGSTGDKYLVGISVACYRFVGVDPDSGLCIYVPVDGCNCKCFSPSGRRLSHLLERLVQGLLISRSG